MKSHGKKIVANMLAVVLLCASVITPIETTVVANEKNGENGVTVTTPEQLLNALSAGETLITISGEITVGDEADASGKMLPLEIPENVTLQGADSNAILYCRCPVQITGDGVSVRNLQMKFLSSDALESVPHREIFLAGHSLVLDNVNTYQAGSDGSLGNLGGTEEELLPTVYAGGFEGTTVSGNASLTIQNANVYTMFQAIYMGHDEGTDSKVRYTGKATLAIASKTVVRNGIYTNQNSGADIYVSGAEYSNLSSVAFYGNANTRLQIEKVSVNSATVDQVGTVIIKDNGYLQLASGGFGDVTLQGGACLDLNNVTEVTVAGDFTGGSYDGTTDTRGVLVLNAEGWLNVEGTVTGITLLHTGNRYFTGTYSDGRTYVSTADKAVLATAIMLPEDQSETYEMECVEGDWTVYKLLSGGGGDYEFPVIGEITVVSAPESVDVSKIVSADYVPASQAPYCNVVWKDDNGNAYTEEEVCEERFYASDMVIAIRSDYWNSDAYDDETDWGVPVWFEQKEESPECYYFYTESDYEINSGSYTYLFCSEWFEELGDVANVKAQLEGKVKAQFEVIFYDSSKGETPSSVTDNGTEPSLPVHTHDSGTKTVIPASPGKNGEIKTVCTSCGTILKTETISAPKSITLSEKRYTYNGKLCKPRVKVKDVSGRLIDVENYTITYTKNKKVGTATVRVSFKGNYSGSMKAAFTIRPKKTKIAKITSSSKKFVVKWKKVSAQNSGYEIQYSTSKKFTKKKTKTLVINKRKQTKATIKKPKAGKKYFVRIRTFKKVKVDGKTKKFYSAWSKVKAAK